jgi:hypothetical protein
MRHATAVDIVRRLTTTPYLTALDLTTSAHLGDTYTGIRDAIDDAATAGFIAPVPSAAHADLLTVADGTTYCQTCIDGCTCPGGNPAVTTSCGHRGCWGPNATNDCTGIAVARYVDKRHPGLYITA